MQKLGKKAERETYLRGFKVRGKIPKIRKLHNLKSFEVREIIHIWVVKYYEARTPTRISGHDTTLTLRHR